jgi:hypothetical protein
MMCHLSKLNEESHLLIDLNQIPNPIFLYLFLVNALSFPILVLYCFLNPSITTCLFF